MSALFSICDLLRSLAFRFALLDVCFLLLLRPHTANQSPNRGTIATTRTAGITKRHCGIIATITNHPIFSW